MTGKFWLGVLTAMLLAYGVVSASSAEVDVQDAHGRSLADAVIELAPAQTVAAGPISQLPQESIIDQRDETFVPRVTLIRKGGHVIFTNNDTTMHQVYSFSPIKQFAFEIDEGERSRPVIFEKAGIAAIGCNIHDQMITYVYVAEQPWAAISDRNGRAVIDAMPPGKYRGIAWHPQLPPSASPPVFWLTVSGSGATAAVRLPVVNAVAKKPMHMQMY